MALKYDHSTLSYALTISNLTVQDPILITLLSFHIANILKSCDHIISDQSSRDKCTFEDAAKQTRRGLIYKVYLLLSLKYNTSRLSKRSGD
jgi:hypothetical protein